MKGYSPTGLILLERELPTKAEGREVAVGAVGVVEDAFIVNYLESSKGEGNIS